MASLRRPEPLDEEAFDEAARSLIEDAERHVDAAWRPKRERGWEWYRGHVETKAEPGGDRTVAFEIRDAVHQLLPEVMEQLAGGEEPVEYYTHDPQKHQDCRDATLFASGVWWEGEGWEALHDGVMDGAVGGLGAIKVYRRERYVDGAVEQAEGLRPERLDQLEQVGTTPDGMEVEVLDRQDQTEEFADPVTGAPIPVTTSSSATLRMRRLERQIRVECPRMEDLICTAAPTEDEALCIGERRQVRMGDLVGMGFGVDELDEIGGLENRDRARRETQLRTGREVHDDDSDHGVWSLMPVDIYEVYLR